MTHEMIRVPESIEGLHKGAGNLGVAGATDFRLRAAKQFSVVGFAIRLALLLKNLAASKRLFTMSTNLKRKE